MKVKGAIRRYTPSSEELAKSVTGNATWDAVKLAMRHRGWLVTASSTILGSLWGGASWLVTTVSDPRVGLPLFIVLNGVAGGALAMVVLMYRNAKQRQMRLEQTVVEFTGKVDETKAEISAEVAEAVARMEATGERTEDSLGRGVEVLREVQRRESALDQREQELDRREQELDRPSR